jgi:hypothetical protein
VTNLIGRVNFTAVLDGKNTPREAEQIGRKAGAAAGEGYDQEWTKTFRDTLSESGKRSFDAWQKAGEKDGGVYGDMFNRRLLALQQKAIKSFEGIRLDRGFLDNFAKGFDDAGLAAGELQVQLRALEGIIDGRSLNAAKRQVDEWAQAQRDAAIETNRSIVADENRRSSLSALTRELQEHVNAHQNLLRSQVQLNQTIGDVDWQRQITLSDGVTASLRRMASATDENSFAWRDLSHNTRQWTLIIAAVMAGMEDIATLGSAAGAGLIALGGAATGAITGIGGVAALLVTLNRDIEELPANLHDVKNEFDGFTASFGELRNAVASGAALELDGVFDSLGESVRALTPQFTKLGTTVGKVFNDLADNVRPGSKALGEITTALDNADDNFRRLAGSTGTFGLALVRSFNRAQPLVEDLTDWIDTLAERFDAFTQSSNFDQWIRTAQTTFGSLGQLLDATGRSLNNLVTPDSVNRLTGFLDNLTAFMPNLERFLDVLGKLDIFGLIAQGLNDFGRAMEPLAEPAADLAEALNRIVSITFDEFADALTGIAQALAPVAQGFADFLDSVPEDVLRGAANGLVVLGGAIVGFKAVANINDIVQSFKGFTGSVGQLGPQGEVAARGLTTLGRAFAGLAIGTSIVVGVEALSDVISKELLPSTAQVSNKMLTAANSTEIFAAALYKQGIGTQQADDLAKGLGQTLDVLIGRNWYDGPLLGSQAAVQSSLVTIGDTLGRLAQTDLPAAQQQFRTLAESQNLTKAQQAELLNQMGPYRDALLSTGEATGGLASDAELLALAMGSTVSTSTDAATGITNLGGAAATTQADIDALAQKAIEFSEATLNTRSSAREFEAALDDLTASIAENGDKLDITTAKGRANEAAIDDVAAATLRLAEDTRTQTGSQQAANDVISTGRARMIEMLGAFGITGAAAQAYVDKLGLIPQSITTKVLADTAAAQAGIDRFIRLNDGRTIRVFTTGVMDTGKGTPKFYADGGIVRGPQLLVAGEAGTEAIVPMDRDLNRVDPSVRWLSAIAQGKGPVPMANGGVVRGGGQTIEAGAITIQGVRDEYAAANEVLYRLSERVGR